MSTGYEGNYKLTSLALENFTEGAFEENFSKGTVSPHDMGLLSTNTSSNHLLHVNSIILSFVPRRYFPVCTFLGGGIIWLDEKKLIKTMMFKITNITRKKITLNGVKWFHPNIIVGKKKFKTTIDLK